MAIMGIKIDNLLISIILTIWGVNLMAAESAPYFKYVDEIVNDFEREMYKDYGIVCIGSGGRQATCVETIELVFWVYQRGTTEQARELFVKSKTRLAEKVNAHAKIRPFLKKSPFTSEEAKISLSFRKNDGSRYLDESVALVCSSRGGNIAYERAELQTYESPGLQIIDGPFIPGKTDKKEVLVNILTEPYEEAVRIVESKKRLEK